MILLQVIVARRGISGTGTVVTEFRLKVGGHGGTRKMPIAGVKIAHGMFKQAEGVRFRFTAANGQVIYDGG